MVEDKSQRDAGQGKHCRWRVVAGFTLVELLVVIAIIGVLVGLLLPAVQVTWRALGTRSGGEIIRAD